MSENLITKVDLIDTFSCSNAEYLKIRRGELKRHALGCKQDMRVFSFLNLFYPLSKPIMEKLYGLPCWGKSK